MSMPPNWSNEFDLSDIVLNPSTYRGNIFGVGALSGILFGLDNERNHLRAYNECPPLKSIVSRRAKFFNVGVIDVVNTNTGKSAQGTSEATAYRNIIKRPNPLQTQKQFFAQQNIYIDIFGYCPVLIIRPYGVNDAVSAIWNIPPWLFNIQYTGAWLQQTEQSGIFKGYTMTWTGGAINMDAKNVKLIFDDGFGTDMDINLTIPDSRLRSQELPISNIIASLTARNSLITRRGATGILSNGAKDSVGHIKMPEGEKEKVQQDFSRYGIVGQEYQVIISEANLTWQQMGFSTKDLMLFEEIEDDVNSLCDAYGWFPELLARTKGATFDNKEKAEKMVYTGTIIPESQSRLEQFSDGVIGVNNPLRFVASFSHAPALQVEKLQQAQARKELDTSLEKEFKNNVITLDEWRLALEKDPIPVNGSKYYYELIEMGWTFGNTTVSGGDNMPTNSNPEPTTQQANAA